MQGSQSLLLERPQPDGRFLTDRMNALTPSLEQLLMPSPFGG